MKIYEYEILDGLQNIITSSASSSIDCDIIKTYTSDQVSDDVKNAIAQTCPGLSYQKDLYYINSVLVSNGWNKNDDVFDKFELWAARETPKNKPFNYMHVATDILGHIIDSLVVDVNGTKIDSHENDFDIVISSVIYKYWGDDEKSKRIEKIIKEIEENKWFVSMECCFDDFDYAVITPTNEHKVIKRDKDSAFLTKHLRIYGGKGEYEGYKLGRLLRNIVFVGVGLVDKPANPRSIIFNKDVNPFSARSIIMAVEKENLENQVAEFNKKLEEYAQALNEQSEKAAGQEKIIKELQDMVDSLKKESEEKDKEIQKYKNDIKNMRRKASLVDLGVEGQEADQVVARFDKVDDEVFGHILALYKEKSKKAMDLKKEDKKEEEEIELDVTEETEALLKDVGDNKSVNERAIASAIEWLSNNVLRTTKGVK